MGVCIVGCLAGYSSVMNEAVCSFKWASVRARVRADVFGPPRRAQCALPFKHDKRGSLDDSMCVAACHLDVSVCVYRVCLSPCI